MKSQLSTAGLPRLILVFICLVVILYGLHKALLISMFPASRRKKIMVTTIIIIICWATLLAILSFNGFFADFSKLPPRPALALFVPLPFALIFAFSKTGKQILLHVAPHWLALIQAFRIFVELLLLAGFIKNLLPVQMTFEGRNFDVLTGLLALPAGYLISKHKMSSATILIFNVTGILLLLNILIIAVLSMPTPFRYFMNEPSNTLIAQFPFIFLPGILVPLAYTFHIFSLRQWYLLKHKNESL